MSTLTEEEEDNIHALILIGDLRRYVEELERIKDRRYLW